MLRATLTTRPTREATTEHAPAREPAPLLPHSLAHVPARAPIQLYYDKDGKWVDGAPPKGWKQLSGFSGKASVRWAPPEEAEAHEVKQKEEEEIRDPRSARNVELRRQAMAGRARPSAEEVRATPERLVREDHNFASTRNQRGHKKAFLGAAGLHPAGKKQVSAAAHMNAESGNKEKSNRISFKKPVEAEEEDGSQQYGGAAQTLTLKARKLVRAKRRGKADAQHVTIHSTDAIDRQLRQDRRLSGADRGKFRGWAQKDREYQAEVDFVDPEENEHYIPPRFLVMPDGQEIHDSDSESEDESPSPARRRGRGRGRRRRAAKPAPEASASTEAPAPAPVPLPESAAASPPEPEEDAEVADAEEPDAEQPASSKPDPKPRRRRRRRKKKQVDKSSAQEEGPFD